MAEPDRREAILERLKAVMESVDGIKHSFRNQITIPETRRPAALVLDADEVADESFSPNLNRAAALAPILAIMTPEIFLLLGAKAEDVGPALNTLRIKTIKAVLTDETLVNLCKDGDIRYLGFATGLSAQPGRSMEAEAGLQFAFRYMVYPSKL